MGLSSFLELDAVLQRYIVPGWLGVLLNALAPVRILCICKLLFYCTLFLRFIIWLVFQDAVVLGDAHGVVI